MARPGNCVRPVFQAFLRDTLALWSIEAIVRDGRGACLAQLHDDSGRIVRIPARHTRTASAKRWVCADTRCSAA
jgi:hypothetical protein